ncbi:MAG TPA: class I SAM-dependent methyltransferase [Anaerolineae bacterium]|nr:class I SAM-dependent methyltransferase [Anaerolineae bacterium]HMR63876.1 class I SAM-dependent methyltransferase [Anaerolineae bacterium]
MSATTAPKQPFYWDNYRDTTVGRYLSQREITFISRVLNDAAPPPQRIADLACGSGRITVPLFQAGLNIIGTDLDPVALASFPRQSQPVPLAQSNALHFPFTNESLDCVIAIQCFEYFDQDRFFQECYRVLARGGLLVFSAVNRQNYKRQLKKLLGRYNAQDTTCNKSCQEVLRATRDYDFDLHTVSGYNWIPFDRLSNNRLVDLTAKIEQILRLDRLYQVSPWFLLAARKRSA